LLASSVQCQPLAGFFFCHFFGWYNVGGGGGGGDVGGGGGVRHGEALTGWGVWWVVF